jgi:hypothetical protein
MSQLGGVISKSPSPKPLGQFSAEMAQIIVWEGDSSFFK